ncbi:MAG: hypothetical protein ACLT98_16035 [Eggerthellaceae bacterium]
MMARRSSAAVKPRIQLTWFFTRQSGAFERRGHAAGIAAIGHRARADKLAQTRRAHGQQRGGDTEPYDPDTGTAHVSRRKGVDELPRLTSAVRLTMSTISLVHRVGAAMRERDL